MNQLVTLIVLAVWLFSSCNALFFGLFNSQEISKPDLVIGEEKVAGTDRTAYENYIRATERVYPPYIHVRYVPLHVYQPQYPEYVPSYSTDVVYYQPNSIYQSATVPNGQHKTESFQGDYFQEQANPSSYIQRPIVVLPFETFQQSFENVPEKTRDIDNVNIAPISFISNSKATKFKVSKPQMPTTLYDLPISSIAPDFRTGGHITKPLETKTEQSNNPFP